jgi:RNA polymerase sigma-70 factor (ECF subfamily)
MEFDQRSRSHRARYAAAKSYSNMTNELFASCMPGLQRTAERLLRNKEDSEDVLQEALLSGFQKIHQFERRAQFSTWMQTILRNKARTMWRQRRCRPISSVPRSEECEEGRIDSADEVADAGLNPEEEYRQKESSRIVADVLAQLPPKYREVVRLCKIQELNVTDTAEKLGIQVGTVKARMHRARRMIMRYLNDRQVSQAAQLRSARRLGILRPHGGAMSRTKAMEDAGVKRTRRAHSHRVCGGSGELSRPSNRLARNTFAHYPPQT